VRSTINHAKLKFPVAIINYGENLINILTNTTDFSNRFFYIDCAEIKPDYLKDILLECSLADMCEKFGEFGENPSAYSDSLNRFKVDDASCVLFVEACDRYAEKLKTQENPTM